MSQGPHTPNRVEEERDALLCALSGRDANLGRQAGERTRRAVRLFSLRRQEQVLVRRRTVGLAALACFGLLVLVAPNLWYGLSDLLGGEPFGDLSTQLALLLAFLLCAVVASLAAGWLSGTPGRKPHA